MISKLDFQVNEFPPELFARITAALEVARDLGRPALAAFDADGTLWDTDIGEGFFEFELREGLLSGLPPDPVARYREMKLVDKPAAYAWLAQINAGHALEQVRAWARAAVDARPGGLPIFASQRRLIDHLRSLNFEIYVVTASIKWAVEPAAARLGIDADHVLGITTHVSAAGVVGTEWTLPITWREGKAERLLQATGGRRPVLASGNTYGDIALLESATDVRLAVSTQSAAGELHEEERRLWAEAEARGWYAHAFRQLE